MPDWISRTLGRVLRSREWTNSSSDNAIAQAWVSCRPGTYRSLWLLVVTCQQLQSLLIIPPSGRQGCHTRPRWGGVALCGEDRVEGGRRQGTKGVRALFVLIVASFPSDTEVEQDGGGVSMSEQTLPQKWELISSLLSVASSGVHLQQGQDCFGSELFVVCWWDKTGT